MIKFTNYKQGKIIIGGNGSGSSNSNIFSEYEAQLKAKAELEAQENKNCGGCYWGEDNYNDSICGHCFRNDEMRDMYEPKKPK